MDKQKRKFLSGLKKGPILREDAVKIYTLALVHDVARDNYVATRKLPNKNGVMEQYCEITPAGKDALAAYRREGVRFRIPLIISIIALILSAIALVQTNVQIGLSQKQLSTPAEKYQTPTSANLDIGT